MKHSGQDASEVEFLCKPADFSHCNIMLTEPKAKRREILRFLTYRTQQFDASVVSIPTKKTTQIVTGLPCTTLGDLEPLPLESLNEILRYSDLHSASAFRSLNRRARAVVESSFPYNLILHNAPNVFAVLEKTGIASHFSVDDVFQALCTPSCHICGEFGTYLWIPECIRCCFSCVMKAPELMPVSEPDARTAFGLTKSGLASVPIMTTLPGVYTTRQRLYRRTRRLLSRERARQAALDIHGGLEDLHNYVHFGTFKVKTTYSRRVAASAETTKNDHTRFMAVVPLPYLDPSLRITHTGLSCRGCQFARKEAALFRTYTTKGILEHFKKCSGARELWNAHRKMNFPHGKSYQGTIRPYLRHYVQMLHERTS